jgi:hypothetical protein
MILGSRVRIQDKNGKNVGKMIESKLFEPQKTFEQQTL